MEGVDQIGEFLGGGSEAERLAGSVVELAGDLTIDLAGLLLTIMFWYALTENLRRLDLLKEIVAEGSREQGIQGFREIGAVRTSHHERRVHRGLPFPLSALPWRSPSWWLAHGIPIFFGSTWLALIAVAIVTAA